MNKEMYTVRQLYTPTIYTSHIDGKSYVIPSWLEVPSDTTLDQIIWERPFSKSQEIWVQIGTIKARRGSTIYKISKFGKKYKCSCSKQFECNHIHDYLNIK